MKFDIEKIAINIVKGEKGIYESKGDTNISYPESGNDACMQIEDDSFWFKHRNNIIAESVKNFNQGRTFFDIGGGNGFVAKRIQDEGSQVVLVEPGKQGAVNAKTRGVENIVCSTLEDAGFLKDSIDSVGLFDVVEHIEDDLKFMKNINNFLNKDGLVYITVPAHKMLWSKEDDDAGHFKRYTLKSMGQLLKDSGFKVEYSTYFFSILPLPIFLLRTIPSKLGLNKNSNDIDKHKKEHSNKEGMLSGFIQSIWNKELAKVRNKKKISFGGSCFVVAKKIVQ
jgi:SAM-dependent methyltransferase